MSEHYDFHYHPTGSGAISGQQVLQQTEDAINELGDYVNDNVGGAMDVAQQALETAQTAETNAQTALDTANSFSGAIQSAQQDASTALSTAQTAQTTASNANNTAIQAQQDASSAVTTANNASGQVSTLSGTVTALGQRVTTAEGNIGQNTSDITALTTRVGTAEGNITTLQNDVSIAQGNASSAMATAGTVKQQAYVLRYSSLSITDNSTIAYSTLDNTDNIKSGDKVFDVDGKIFTVVSVDTANQTVTVGSALIDLALDSNVVHTSGNETVGGTKTFTSSIKGYNTNSTQDTVSIDLRSSKVARGNTQDGTDTFGIGFKDKNNASLMTVTCIKRSTGSTTEYHTVNTSDNSDNALSESYSFNLSKDGTSTFRPETNNKTLLGTLTNNWKGVYATNYYYGSNNVEFSTKFVTADTTQTITESKTFTKNVKIKNTDVTRGATTGSGTKAISYTDSNDDELSSISVNKNSNGSTSLVFKTSTTDNTDALISSSFQFFISKSGTKVINPTTSEDIALGRSSNKWSDVVTAKVNGLTPSSLSMPTDNDSNIIDISSYITDLSGNINLYTPPANGYLTFTFSSGSQVQIYPTTGKGLCSKWVAGSGSGIIRGFIPVLKNIEMKIAVNGTIMDNFYFIPCQGNV